VKKLALLVVLTMGALAYLASPPAWVSACVLAQGGCDLPTSTPYGIGATLTAVAKGTATKSVQLTQAAGTQTQAAGSTATAAPGATLTSRADNPVPLATLTAYSGGTATAVAGNTNILWWPLHARVGASWYAGTLAEGAEYCGPPRGAFFACTSLPPYYPPRRWITGVSWPAAGREDAVFSCGWGLPVSYTTNWWTPCSGPDPLEVRAAVESEIGRTPWDLYSCIGSPADCEVVQPGTDPLIWEFVRSVNSFDCDVAVPEFQMPGLWGVYQDCDALVETPTPSGPTPTPSITPTVDISQPKFSLRAFGRNDDDSGDPASWIVWGCTGEVSPDGDCAGGWDQSPNVGYRDRQWYDSMQLPGTHSMYWIEVRDELCRSPGGCPNHFLPPEGPGVPSDYPIIFFSAKVGAIGPDPVEVWRCKTSHSACSYRPSQNNADWSYLGTTGYGYPFWLNDGWSYALVVPGDPPTLPDTGIALSAWGLGDTDATMAVSACQLEPNYCRSKPGTIPYLWATHYIGRTWYTGVDWNLTNGQYLIELWRTTCGALFRDCKDQWQQIPNGKNFTEVAPFILVQGYFSPRGQPTVVPPYPTWTPPPASGAPGGGGPTLTPAATVTLPPGTSTTPTSGPPPTATDWRPIMTPQPRPPRGGAAKTELWRCVGVLADCDYTPTENNDDWSFIATLNPGENAGQWLYDPGAYGFVVPNNPQPTAGPTPTAGPGGGGWLEFFVPSDNYLGGGNFPLAPSGEVSRCRPDLGACPDAWSWESVARYWRGIWLDSYWPLPGTGDVGNDYMIEDGPGSGLVSQWVTPRYDDVTENRVPSIYGACPAELWRCLGGSGNPQEVCGDGFFPDPAYGWAFEGAVPAWIDLAPWLLTGDAYAMIIEALAYCPSGGLRPPPPVATPSSPFSVLGLPRRPIVLPSLTPSPTPTATPTASPTP